MKIQTITDVVEFQLCAGCGVCAYLAPDSFKMIDDLEHGRRPLATGRSSPDAERDAFAACPGIELRHTFERTNSYIAELTDAWGPILELWEGHAADEEIRFRGSSGGVATALSLHALEKTGASGVLHTGSNPDVPFLNQTILSGNREQLLAGAGSRYAPASPCEELAQIEQQRSSAVFVGKPCDVAATRKARALRPALDQKLALTISFCCAGTPSTAGTLALLKEMGIDKIEDVDSLRYRGHGWPGEARATFQQGGVKAEAKLSYADSWGKILQKHRPWRCVVCVDHTGEFADVVVGDPWYREVNPGEAGSSLIIVRTQLGRSALQAAMSDGYIVAKRVPPRVLPDSQKGFTALRGHVWARNLVARLMGAGAPRYRSMPTFRFWITHLSLEDRARSLLGTARRVLRRGLRKRIKLNPWTPPTRAKSGVRPSEHS